MPDRRHSGPTCNILQGESRVSDAPDERMTTILGSCVAVCLFDPVRKIGGMNHFLLPSGQTDGGISNRYGIHAMEQLINELIKAGGEKSRLQAKAFGGARMTAGLSDIGAANAAFAQEFLAKESIPCTSQDFGGTRARRLFFFPTTGRAEVHLVAETPDPAVTAKPATPVQPDITLF